MVVWCPWLLDTTRFGPDVVVSTLCCHADGLANLLIVKKAHGKTNRHDRSGPLYVHLVSGPDNLEWSIIRHTSLFAEILHDDVIVRCPTFQKTVTVLINPQSRQVFWSPFCVRQSSVSVLLKRFFLSISDTDLR